MLKSNGTSFWSRVNQYPKLLLLLAIFTLASIIWPTPGLAENTTAAGLTQVTYEQAVYETLAWATGTTSATKLYELDKRIELSSYRYGIEPEFGLCVVAAEARLYPEISWARYDTWSYIERTTKQKQKAYPNVMSDLDTALSELRGLMKTNSTVNGVLIDYWAGPKGEFNPQTVGRFVEIASKLFNGFEPYREQRLKERNRSKYGRGSPSHGEVNSAWEGLAIGDLDGYRSQLGSMPELAEQLKSFPGYEEDYVLTIRSYNPSLTQNEALVIARAILTYCEKTNSGEKAKFFVDPRFVIALVRAESAFRPKAVSKVGALGLGQLMPATVRSHGIKDAFDPIQNLFACVQYLEREMFRWQGNDDWLALVAASYNAGPGAVMKYNGVPPYRETRNFVATVRRYYEKLTKRSTQ